MGALAPGRWLHRYRVDAALGAGGMGEVYRGFDATLQRAVALKVLRTEGAPPSPAQRARFLREARAAAALRHPGIVTVFDVGEVDDTPYIAMELLEGRPLAEYVFSGVSIDRRISWLVQVADALAAAHSAGFIHRDIKPSNVIVCPDDTAKVLDFGVVRSVHLEDPASGARGPLTSFQTSYGDIVGTPRYMAPEQAAGGSIDARIDQFAWGLVAYELLTSRRPRDVDLGFSAEAGWSVPAPSIAALCPALPPAIATAIARALERNANARFPSMAALLAAIGRSSRSSLSSAPAYAAPAYATPTLPGGTSTQGTPLTLTLPPTQTQTPPPSATHVLPPWHHAPTPPPHTPRRGGVMGIALAVSAVAIVVLGATAMAFRPELRTLGVAAPTLHPIPQAQGGRSPGMGPPGEDPPRVTVQVISSSYPDAAVRAALGPNIEKTVACVKTPLVSQWEYPTAGLSLLYTPATNKTTVHLNCEPKVMELCRCVESAGFASAALGPPPKSAVPIDSFGRSDVTLVFRVQ